ncbi:MAG: zinc-finger-containing protein [Pseudomonadota bacterium]
MRVFCCNCDKDVDARLTDGKEVYPHRGDLAELPFWKCDDCKKFVGCHHRSDEPTKPLGSIPTPHLRKARSEIHAILDPIWRNRKMDRSKLYARIARHLGIPEYHTAELRTVEDAREVYRCVVGIRRELGLNKTWGKGR